MNLKSYIGKLYIGDRIGLFIVVEAFDLVSVTVKLMDEDKQRFLSSVSSLPLGYACVKIPSSTIREVSDIKELLLRGIANDQ